MFIATRKPVFNICLDVREKIEFEIIAISTFTEPKHTNVFFRLSKRNDIWRAASKRIQANLTEQGYAIFLNSDNQFRLSLGEYTASIECVNNEAILSVTTPLYDASYVVPKLVCQTKKGMLYPSKI